jgi:PPOX class probable F420-dependent enzyme
VTVVLTEAQRKFVDGERRATLATIAPDGRARLVPVCFVLIGDVMWSPLDEKPKSVDDVRSLARVRDIERDRRVTLLVDRWSDDWSELAWVRIDGRAAVVESDPVAVAVLRAKYSQYADHDLESRPMIRTEIVDVRSWAASPANADATRRSVE